MIDTHPLMPTGDAVRSAIGRLADRLDKSGARVARASTSLPDLANSARLYMKLLNAARSPRLTPAALAEAQGIAAALSPDDRSLQAERARGWGMIHREWLATDAAPAVAATVAAVLPRVRRRDLSGCRRAGLSA